MSMDKEVPQLRRGALARGLICVFLFYGLTLLALMLWGMVHRTAVANAMELRRSLVVGGVAAGLHVCGLLGPLLRRAAGSGLRARWVHSGGAVLVLGVGSIGALVITWMRLSTWEPPMF